MNNRGWGLNEMLFLCAILGIALIVAVAIVQSSFNDMVKTQNNTAVYKSYETTLIAKAKTYYADMYEKSSDTVIISYKNLIDKDYMTNLKDPETENNCSGYVVVNDDNYDAYLKCGTNYMTNGYNSNFDQ